MATLHVYEVAAPTPAEPKPVPFKVDTTTIAADGDAAKVAAKVHLEAHGYVVRSLNWGPDPHPKKPPVLIAYVMKKGVA